VGWLIRNVTQPVFHKGNSLQKKKEPKKKKGLWKMPQLWKSAQESDAFGHFFLDADSHSCLEKPRQRRSAFPHFPQARQPYIHGIKPSP